MATVILPIILAATVTKTVLVVDAIFSTDGRVGVVGRAAQTLHSQASRAPARSFVASSPRHQRPIGPTSAGALKVRLAGRGTAIFAIVIESHSDDSSRPLLMYFYVYMPICEVVNMVLT